MFKLRSLTGECPALWSSRQKLVFALENKSNSYDRIIFADINHAYSSV